nr:hypothetical protein Itr_chr13CG05720 [Ipomoea trifida]GMD74072.1 hypothetical protein Iba_chr13aCG1820 [Ipomoea batatas]GMD75716.1 hypothetical protein Iba_chr13bCG3350 [Ipomoea batatas]GMD77582.1 hypothetical protein Iba_chr13cCG4740 [Ipomoea batatas]GME11089.1 hypothetical protein Iba_scaffold11342.2CG0060 [Ipomoea batatas]
MVKSFGRFMGKPTELRIGIGRGNPKGRISRVHKTDDKHIQASTHTDSIKLVKLWFRYPKQIKIGGIVWGRRGLEGSGNEPDGESGSVRESKTKQVSTGVESASN